MIKSINENIKYSLWDKLMCLIGRHEWRYDGPNENNNRFCKKCKTEQQYVLIDFGRSKTWVT